jgi:hypothetical protein
MTQPGPPGAGGPVGERTTLGDDLAAARATAERIFGRTPSVEPAVQMADRMGRVFSTFDCEPCWRERFPELAIPVLVVTV